jgi:hypothetical protein
VTIGSLTGDAGIQQQEMHFMDEEDFGERLLKWPCK